jgi:hypothetical protein
LTATVETSPETSPPGLESDWHPYLVARAWPNTTIEEAFDRWEIDKHIADLMTGPGTVMVAYFKTVLDGLPEAYKSSGICMAYYTARDIDGLYAWLRSDELAAAVEDGSQWFGNFNELDFETFTGNVYVPLAVLNRAQRKPDEAAPLFIERFEVTDAEAEEFDAWLHEVHLPAVGNHEGVLRARTFSAIREGIPIPYYYSPGSRMIAAELADDFRAALLSPELLAALEDSMRWDRRLSYVKRDVYRHAAHLYSEHGGKH